jgi:hypothetical protein
MVLTAVAITCVAVLTLTSALDRAAAMRLAAAGAAWLAAVAAMAAAGVFASGSGVGTPAIGVAVLAPVVIVAAMAVRPSATRALALGVPLPVLVAVHVGRLLGVFFLLLHAEGRLPRTFALSAGWGDIAVATLAGPLAWAIHRRVTGWWTLTLVWNSIGFLDLVTAVVLGVGSAPDSPLRFIFETPSSGAMGTLPWMLIPGFLVPLYQLSATHARSLHGRPASPGYRPARPR